MKAEMPGFHPISSFQRGLSKELVLFSKTSFSFSQRNEIHCDIYVIIFMHIPLYPLIFLLGDPQKISF